MISAAPGHNGGRADQGTVGRMMNRAFGALVTLVLVTGLAGLVAAVPPFVLISRPLSEVIDVRAVHSTVRTPLIRAQTSVDGYLLTGGGGYLVSYEQAKQAYPDAMAALRSTAADHVPREVAELDEQATRWWALADPLVPGTPGSPPSELAINALHAQFRRVISASLQINVVLSAEVVKLNRTNDILNTVALTGMVSTIVLGVLVGVWIGRSATRRITDPLGQVVRVLDRLGSYERDARVTLTEAPAEIATVAAAVNATADEADAERDMFAAFQEHSAAVRQHLSRKHAISAAARSAGELVDADHAVIRLVPDEDGPTAAQVWSAPQAPGDPSPLAGTPVDWLAMPPAAAFVASPDSGPQPPETERAALRAAEAGPVITVAFGEGADPVGYLTVLKRHGSSPWRPYEVHLISMLAADLGRILTQAKLFEHANELVARLREVDAAKSEFISTVSHELRTPLTSVSGYLEVLIEKEAGPLTSAQDRMITVIDRNVERLRRLIEDLLLMSRIEAGRLTLTREPIDLGSLIESVTQVVEPNANKARVTLIRDTTEPITVHGDRAHVERAVLNVVANAVKFTPADGTVTITARTEGPDAVLSVRDTGIGIPAADLPYLFSRFFRASNATRQSIPGTGLGLAIVANVVERHSGTITVDSHEGVGTTITIRLPTTESSPAGATDVPRPAP
ncbi:ATP-binding protein [Actinoplanes sp. NPDC026623]|uniref:ATP-binding protein n=1 Tax=Actinoplanes sp. NPDC026623 TaxID=3155610 RepID=UPI0033F6218A